VAIKQDQRKIETSVVQTTTVKTKNGMKVPDTPTRTTATYTKLRNNLLQISHLFVTHLLSIF
jgi:hypothetical protein